MAYSHKIIMFNKSYRIPFAPPFFIAPRTRESFKNIRENTKFIRFNFIITNLVYFPCVKINSIIRSFYGKEVIILFGGGYPAKVNTSTVVMSFEI